MPKLSKKYTAKRLVEMPVEEAFDILMMLPDKEGRRLMSEIYHLNSPRHSDLHAMLLVANLNRNVLAGITAEELLSMSAKEAFRLLKRMPSDMRNERMKEIFNKDLE